MAAACLNESVIVAPVANSVYMAPEFAWCQPKPIETLLQFGDQCWWRGFELAGPLRQMFELCAEVRVLEYHETVPGRVEQFVPANCAGKHEGASTDQDDDLAVPVVVNKAHARFDQIRHLC